ncbi:MAG: Mrr restriction system protein [Geobacter sp.]|nr:Mrr restriction system protein [Geobacter sp.]
MSKSRELASKVIYEAFKVLQAAGGQLSGRDLIESLQQTLKFDDWALFKYEKTGNLRWVAILHLFSIDCSKAGFLTKEKGVWFLTPEGEEAMLLGPTGLLDQATAKYKEWEKSKPDADLREVIEDNDKKLDEMIEEHGDKIDVSTYQDQGNASIRIYINTVLKNPYDFQKAVAALLRAMGYHTPFVAPKGKDGGIDIIAYQDPFGAKRPRIKVQVKHQNSTADVKVIRELVGVLKDGDIGLFVSTGGFTSDAKSSARTVNAHIELIDIDRFVALWQEYYSTMPIEDQNLIPLRTVYFIESKV